MGKLTEFVKRNMKIYLRDRSAVFFSLMTMIIVIGLMLLFLGDMNVEAVTKMLSALPGRDAQADEAKAPCAYVDLRRHYPHKCRYRCHLRPFTYDKGQS